MFFFPNLSYRMSRQSWLMRFSKSCTTWYFTSTKTALTRRRTATACVLSASYAIFSWPPPAALRRQIPCTGWWLWYWFFSFFLSYLSLLFSLLSLSNPLVLVSCYLKKTGFWYNMLAVAFISLLFVLLFYIHLSPTLYFSSFLSSSLAGAPSSSLPSFFLFLPDIPFPLWNRNNLIQFTKHGSPSWRIYTPIYIFNSFFSATRSTCY